MDLLLVIQCWCLMDIFTNTIGSVFSISEEGLPLLNIVLISAAASSFLLIVAAVIGIFCICKKTSKTGQENNQLYFFLRRKYWKLSCFNTSVVIINAVQRQKEDRSDSALRKPKTRQKVRGCSQLVCLKFAASDGQWTDVGAL